MNVSSADKFITIALTFVTILLGHKSHYPQLLYCISLEASQRADFVIHHNPI